MHCGLCQAVEQLRGIEGRDAIKSKICAQFLNEVLEPLMQNLNSFILSIDDHQNSENDVEIIDNPGLAQSPPLQTAEFGQDTSSVAADRELEVMEVRQMPDGVIGLCCEERPEGNFVKVALREGRTCELTARNTQVKMRPVFSVGEYLRLVNYVYKPASNDKALPCYQTYLFSRTPKEKTINIVCRSNLKKGRISLGFSHENVDPRHFLDTSPEARSMEETTIIQKSNTKSPLRHVGVQGSLNISSLSRNSAVGITKVAVCDTTELGLTAIASRPPSKCEKKRRMNCVCCSEAMEVCSDLMKAHGRHKQQFTDDHTPEGYWDLHFMETQREL